MNGFRSLGALTTDAVPAGIRLLEALVMPASAAVRAAADVDLNRSMEDEDTIEVRCDTLATEADFATVPTLRQW